MTVIWKLESWAWEIDYSGKCLFCKHKGLSSFLEPIFLKGWHGDIWLESKHWGNKDSLTHKAHRVETPTLVAYWPSCRKNISKKKKELEPKKMALEFSLGFHKQVPISHTRADTHTHRHTQMAYHLFIWRSTDHYIAKFSFTLEWQIFA